LRYFFKNKNNIFNYTSNQLMHRILAFRTAVLGLYQ
jgi:hypothetical protein